jgi:hypothetical protein
VSRTAPSGPRAGRRAGLGLAALALAGCAAAPVGPSVVVWPGAQSPPARFDADMATCRERAQAQIEPQVQAANDRAAATAVAATAIGAAIGALFGSPYYVGPSAAWGAGSGLLVGSTLGASGSQVAAYGLQQRYDVAYLQCMVALGHQLPVQAAGGGAPYRRLAVPPSVPPPDTPAPAGLPPLSTPPPPGIPPPGAPPPQGMSPSGWAPAAPAGTAPRV